MTTPTLTTQARPEPLLSPEAPDRAGGGPHTVTETNSVKRKRAELPSNMAHALPTKGEWLSKRYVVNNYILLDLLGTGSYAEVRLCKEKSTDDLFAVKILNKSVMQKRKVGQASTAMDDVKREAASALQFQKALAERLTAELEQLRAAAKAAPEAAKPPKGEATAAKAEAADAKAEGEKPPAATPEKKAAAAKEEATAAPAAPSASPRSTPAKPPAAKATPASAAGKSGAKKKRAQTQRPSAPAEKPRNDFAVA